MPQTAIQKAVLSIRQVPGDPISDAVSRMFDMLQTYDQTVWTGFTCQVDKYGNTEFLLWVEPEFTGKISETSIRKFKIDQCTAVQGDGRPFSAFVKIKASVVI